MTDEVKMKKDQKLVRFSQNLRKNMTREERHLWYDFLRSQPITVNRQRVIGPYIADFYISAAKIVIELDGSQHFEEHAQTQDRLRDDFLESLGITILRYSNYDINNRFDAVCQDILNAIHSKIIP